MTIIEKIISEVNEFSDSKLYAIQGFINLIDSQNFEKAHHDEDPNGKPLDDFDYELLFRTNACRNEETISHEELLRKCGVSRAEI